MNQRLIVGLATAFAISLASPVAWAADKGSEKFVKEAIEGNYAEVSMGQLAEQKGSSEDVKSFGKMLQDDHSKANTKLNSVAQGMGLTPPTGPTKKQMAAHDKLAKASGPAFDREFAKHMVADHKKDIRSYRKEAKKKDDAAAYARDTLPDLEKHLNAAQALEKPKSAAR